jgi:phage shock protein C
MNRDADELGRLGRLYRDPERGLLAGVMAGLADHLGLQPWQARAMGLLGLFFFPPFAVLAYLVAAVLMPPRPRRPPLSPDEQGFWRAVARDPRGTFGTLRYRFRMIDRRIAEIERTVTSSDFKLRREFRDLER